MKNYIINYSALPYEISIADGKVTIYQFTYLMAHAIQNLYYNPMEYWIDIVDINNITEVNSNFFRDNANLATYLTWANNVVSKGKENTTYSYFTFNKGKLAFKDYVNAFAKILAFYGYYDRLPNYVSIETFTSTKANVITLGSNSLGKVELIGPLGNTSSKVKIAYSIGVHVREYQAHETLYYLLNSKGNLNYCYYIYKITLANPTGDYSTDRMNGQLLAQSYILPHALKQKYNLFIDIHSTVGTAYKYSYFVFVPGNKNTNAINIAKVVVSQNKNLVYYNPPSQTSPQYLTLPLVNGGTPTFVFETLTGESYTVTLSKLNSLVNSVDKLFTQEGKLIVPGTYVSIADVLKASKSLRTYMDSHSKKLPSTVQVGSVKVTTAQFNYIMAVAIQRINANNNEDIRVISVAAPKTVNYKIARSVPKATYMIVVNNVIKYINSNKKAPAYTVIGNYKAKYSVYTYSFALILNYYYNYNKLPPNCVFRS